MGHHDSGAKTVKKTGPDEAVGVFCKKDGKPAVLEYFDTPDSIKGAMDPDGEMSYPYGVILNYLFRVDKLVDTAQNMMPVHFAKKKIPYMDYFGKTIIPKEINGYKFETLVTDMVGIMDNCLCFEVSRKAEFAPIKNATGVDSIESARELLKVNGVLL